MDNILDELKLFDTYKKEYLCKIHEYKLMQSSWWFHHACFLMFNLCMPRSLFCSKERNFMGGFARQRCDDW